ncbi:sulfotransferase [Paenibacillus lycopersici]|uniref:Sulfotransferase n=1 Tax=Paenibacillus lycopersici TaxID=2704462 RepID=A0A6C0FXB1_9BACL|nr:sulfotransferase [Paenibacillus lycopersici]QHT59924.1 sulfotransferase [Paenibacillus lycopersici]
MISPDGTNLVFLLCTPRSGSSLVTTMLQNHSHVFATQEMWFLMGLQDMKLAPPRPYGGTGIIRRFYNGIVPEQTYEQACRAFALQIYNGLLRSGDARLVVDKSPRYYCILEFLDRLFPQAKRIWLIRNPLAVIASYKKVYGSKGGADGFHIGADPASQTFNMKMTDVTVGLFRYHRYFSAEHASTYKLYYERLVDAPREELERLCAFIGIAYEEGIERYGDYADTGKSDLYYSMGVGDPFLSDHREAHRDSVDSWKTVLDKNEIEHSCRLLGAAIFRELGYGKELDEAERITGIKFEDGPDTDHLNRRTKQLVDATGLQWIDAYQCRTDDAAIREEATAAGEPAMDQAHSEALRLRMALRTLEQRLAGSYNAQQQLRTELHAYRSKIARLKAIVPFGRRLSKWMNHYISSSSGVKR